MQQSYSLLCYCYRRERLVKFIIVILIVNVDIAVIFGSDKTNHITSDEFFFFLDCVFRGISKVLICKGDTRPQNLNKRLSD